MSFNCPSGLSIGCLAAVVALAGCSRGPAGPLNVAVSNQVAAVSSASGQKEMVDRFGKELARQPERPESPLAGPGPVPPHIPQRPAFPLPDSLGKGNLAGPPSGFAGVPTPPQEIPGFQPPEMPPMGLPMWLPDQMAMQDGMPHLVPPPPPGPMTLPMIGPPPELARENRPLPIPQLPHGQPQPVKRKAADKAD